MKTRERAWGLISRVGLRNTSLRVGIIAIVIANRRSVNRLNALESFMGAREWTL